MKRIARITLLLMSGVVSAGISAQVQRTPENPWLLESYRPVVAVQLCGNPGIVSFDGTLEECKSEFDRLFVKCTTVVPNVRLPAEFTSKQEQVEGLTLIYQCVLAHHHGGATLEEFNRRYPLDPATDSGPGK
jgi:hypothetical protein